MSKKELFIKYLESVNISYTDDLVVRGNLDLSEAEITELPDNLVVKGALCLSFSRVTELPANLVVKGPLVLSFSNVEQLPGDLTVHNFFGLAQSQVKNCVRQPNCGQFNRTIFAVYVNNDIQVSAGCFLGTLEEFIARVKNEYPVQEGSVYINQAINCVKRFRDEQKRTIERAV